MSNRWTQQEIEFLENNYPINGDNFCAQNLGKTLSSVTSKAGRLKLKVLKPCSSEARTTEQYKQEIASSGCKPLEPYITRRTPIMHECANGHNWKVTPDSLLKGSGCPKCSSYRFKEQEPAVLYLVSLKYKDSRIYKVGVTNKSVKERFAGDWRKLEMKVEWELLCKTGEEALTLEKDLLSKAELVNTKQLKRGNSDTVLNYIEKPGLVE